MDESMNKHKSKTIFLEAVTVSVNYTDFLEQCIIQNQNQLDNYVIVTTHEDKKTQDLCRHHPPSIPYYRWGIDNILLSSPSNPVPSNT